MLPWRRIEFTLYSPHPPAECAALAGASTVPFSYLGLSALLSKKPFYGEVSAEFFCLQRRDGARNILRPELVATLEPAGGGTRLECEVRLPLFTSAMVTLIGVVFLSCGLCSPLWLLAEGRASKAALFGSIGGTAVFLLTLAEGQRTARGEPRFLEQTLAACLNARRWSEVLESRSDEPEA